MLPDYAHKGHADVKYKDSLGRERNRLMLNLPQHK